MPQTPHTFFLGQKWERDARSISFFWRVLCMEIASLPFFPPRTSFQLLQFWIWLMLKAAAIQLVLSYRVILLPEGISQWQESHLPLCWPEPVHLPSWLFALLSIEFFGVVFFFFFSVPFPTAIWHVPPWLPYLAVLLAVYMSTDTCCEIWTKMVIASVASKMHGAFFPAE